ncbi:related to ribokinase [Cephalotrichum gorgonifer]|uniref:Ribokinase n=1 Tax=Cephalotrichum gorgonifer TaxID=2041049 RepID=A0AAE8N4R9_9PEZI|nr:related to ribokinase [Cephalotrichum gorgonifer]
MSTKPTIAVIGSINIDLVTYTPRVPRGGETLTAHGFSVGLGGKGANQAVACAKVSRTKTDVQDGTVVVKMVGAVGDDNYGGVITSGLRDVGIDTGDILVREDKKTGAAVIVVESETAENRIMFCPEANATMRPEQFADDLPRPLPDLLIMQMEIPLETVTQILMTAKRLGVPVLLNPAPALKIEEKYYPCITHLVVNETEAAILSGCSVEELESQDGRARVAKIFHDLGVEYVLVTLGSRGVYYSVSGKVQGHVEAQKVTAVDTTAAGDTFVGVYAVEVVKGDFDVEKAVQLANRAASKTVLKKGAQESIPWRDEL